MCLIAHKPAQAPLTDSDLDRIRVGYSNNPDGAGIMYPVSSGIRVIKGLMDVESLVHRLRSRDWTGTPLTVHCRIGTHGENSPSNTHPFPISGVYSDLRATRLTCPVGLVHNGIITTPHDLVEGASDTMGFISRYLAPMARLGATTDQLADIAGLTGSKFALMDTGGDTTLVGTFSRAHGWYWSNESYKPRPVVTRPVGKSRVGRYLYQGTPSTPTPPERPCETCDTPGARGPYSTDAECYACQDCVALGAPLWYGDYAWYDGSD